jgi:hypothetical protein
MTAAPAALASPEVAGDGAWEAAHRALAEGRYGEAEGAYEELVRERGYSAPLLYDLGNAYLRDRKPARALLAYERAQLLAPRDGAIATNLAEARAALGVPVERTVVERLAHSLSMDSWAWLAATGFWFALATGGSAFLWNRRRGPLLAAGTLAALGGALAGTALFISCRDLDRGLVMAPAPVLISPFESAQSGFSLPPGEDVDLGRSRQGYVFVRDTHGRSGWVELAQVAPLIPPST